VNYCYNILSCLIQSYTIICNLQNVQMFNEFLWHKEIMTRIIQLYKSGTKHRKNYLYHFNLKLIHKSIWDKIFSIKIVNHFLSIINNINTEDNEN